MHRIFFAAVMLLSMLGAEGFAKKSELTVIQEDAGVVVKARPIEGSVAELIAVGELDATPEEVFALLWDIPQHKKFMSPIKDATNVSEAATSRVDHIIFYAVLPGLKDRDVVSKTVIAEKSEKTIKLRFKQTEAEGPAPSKEYVRLALREGGWELTAIEGGKKTRATYRLHTDPGVTVAEKLAQNVAAKGIIDVYESIRAELKKK